MPIEDRSEKFRHNVYNNHDNYMTVLRQVKCCTNFWIIKNNRAYFYFRNNQLNPVNDKFSNYLLNMYDTDTKDPQPVQLSTTKSNTESFGKTLVVTILTLRIGNFIIFTKNWNN